MPVSPICQVANGAGPFVATDNGVDVDTGATVSIRLADTTDVTRWHLQVIGTDEVSEAPTLTGVTNGEVSSPSTVVTFTMPEARGRALLFRSTTAGIGGPVTTTFAVYTLTVLGARVGAVNEKREGSTNYGWITLFNPIIRSGAARILYDDSLTTPSTGATSVQDAIDWLKENGSAGPAGSTTSDVLAWNGTAWAPRQLTLDDILPSFQIASFSITGGTTREVGQSVATPAFIASFTSGPPTEVTLTDNDGTAPKDVTATPTSFSSDGSFTKNTYGATVQFTLTANKGSISRSSNLTVTWTQKVFWGVSSSTAIDEAFIEGLSYSALATSRNRTFSLSPGEGEYIYYAFRSAYGTPNFNIGGFDGGFVQVGEAVSVTNTYGFVDTYDVWRSAATNLGSSTVTVT